MFGPTNCPVSHSSSQDFPPAIRGPAIVLDVAPIGLAFGATLVEAQLSTKIFAVFGGAAIVFFLPNMLLKMRCANRSAEIRRHLPDAIDLLEICVSGGMGLDQAWNSVSEEIRQVCQMLADEMALTNLEKHLGADRGTAIRHMAERTNSEELSSLVAPVQAASMVSAPVVSNVTDPVVSISIEVTAPTFATLIVPVASRSNVPTSENLKQLAQSL